MSDDNVKYDFYICSDNISGKSADKNRINKFVNAFKEAGHNAHNCGVGSDRHSHPDKYGCKGSPTKVWVCVVGGDCIGSYWDMQQSYFKKKLNGAKLMFIRQFVPGGISKKAINITSLHNAWDDNFSTKKLSLTNFAKNLDAYFTKYGISYLEGNVSEIVADIKAGKIKGAPLSGLNAYGTSSNNQVKTGYSNNNPFKAYLMIEYTKGVNWNDKTKPPIKTIYVDFSMEAPQATTTNKISYTSGGTKKVITIPPSFTPDDKLPSWLNDTIREYGFNLLNFIQIAEKDINKEYDYYLYRVCFQSSFGKDNSGNLSDNTSNKTENNLLYDNNDNASYKMNLYEIGLFKGDIITPKNYGTSGKKVNDVINDILKLVNYYPKMHYGKYRYNDYVEFSRINNENNKPIFDFYDMSHWNDTNDKIVDGNILNVNNIEYTPINNTLNNSLYIFKGRYDVLRDEETMSYFYERYCDLNNILKYGEQTLLGSDTSNNLSSTEAYNLARTNYLNNFEERRSYTIQVAGIPPVDINDFVRTYMDNPLLDSGDSGLKISSIEWNINPNTSPCIKSTIGLGKPDKKFEIARLLNIQKEIIKNKTLDVPSNIVYNGDENIKGLF